LKRGFIENDVPKQPSFKTDSFLGLSRNGYEQGQDAIQYLSY